MTNTDTIAQRKKVIDKLSKLISKERKLSDYLDSLNVFSPYIVYTFNETIKVNGKEYHHGVIIEDTQSKFTIRILRDENKKLFLHYDSKFLLTRQK